MIPKFDFTSINNHKVVEYNIRNLSSLVFEVTDSCNLRCKYCGYAEFYEGYDPRTNSFLPFSKAKVLIDYLTNIWKNNKYENILQPLTIGFYGGEPLMNPQFIKQVIGYVESLEDIGKAIRYNMTTNAMLLDREMDYLVEKGVFMLISLDGDEIGHSYRVDTHGKNSFHRVINNIQLLKDKYPDYFETHVNFNAVLHNLNGVEEIFNFINSRFNKIPRIAPLNNSGIRPEKRAEFYRTYKNFRQSFQEASNCAKLNEDMFTNAPQISSLSRYLFSHSGNVFDGYYSLKIDKSVLGYAQTGTCTPFIIKMFVTVNGKILQCEKINHEFALGQLYDDHLELDFQKAAEIQNNYLKKIEKQCIVCGKAKYCTQCIYQIDYLSSNSNADCPSFTSSTQNGEKIDNMDFLRDNPHLYKRIINEVTIK